MMSIKGGEGCHLNILDHFISSKLLYLALQLIHSSLVDENLQGLAWKTKTLLAKELRDENPKVYD